MHSTPKGEMDGQTEFRGQGVHTRSPSYGRERLRGINVHKNGYCKLGPERVWARQKKLYTTQTTPLGFCIPRIWFDCRLEARHNPQHSTWLPIPSRSRRTRGPIYVNTSSRNQRIHKIMSRCYYKTKHVEQSQPSA